MATTFSSGTNSYTVPSPATRITIYVRGGGGGDGGDAPFGGSGASGGSGGQVSGELSVSSGDAFTAYVGGNGSNGSNSGGSGTGGSGGTGLYNGGDGAIGEIDAGGSAEGGGGGGGGALSVLERDSDNAWIAVGEGGGGGGGGGESEDDGNASGGGGGGGSRGGLGGSSGQQSDGEDAEGTGAGGDGGDGSTGNGDPGQDGGTSAHGDLQNVSTGTSGFGQIEIIEHVVWSSPGVSTSNVTNTSVDVSWNDANFENQFLVQYRESGTTTWNTYSTLGSTATSETVDGLSEGTDYDFRVVAQNSESSQSATTVNTTVLPEIIDFTIDNVTDTSVDISWTLQSVDEDGVKVFNALSGNALTQESDLSAGTQSHTVSGLLNGRDYDFYVQVYTSDVSKNTSTLSDTTILNDPFNVNLTSNNRNELVLDWNSDLNNGNYRVEYERLSDNTVVSTDSPSYTTNSSSISGVDDGVAYEVRIRSETSDVTGDYVSKQIRVYIPRPWIVNHEFTDRGTVIIEWKQIDSYNGGVFEVYRSETEGNLGTLVHTSQDGNSTQFIDSSVEPMSDYYYTVRRKIE